MSEMTWQGYLRPDGRKGIRNLLLVVYTVQCAQFVAHRIAEDEPDAHVIGFPGCYDNEYAIRLMLALARHPNVGGVLAVGLGCEYTQPARIADVVQQSGRPAEAFFIQEHGSTAESIAYGKRMLVDLRQRAADVEQVPMSWGDMIIGCECGGSDGTSGLAGNHRQLAHFPKHEGRHRLQCRLRARWLLHARPGCGGLGRRCGADCSGYTHQARRTRAPRVLHHVQTSGHTFAGAGLPGIMPNNSALRVRRTARRDGPRRCSVVLERIEARYGLATRLVNNSGPLT